MNSLISISKIEFFVLALFSVVGYIPFLPYFIANIILFLVPCALILHLVFLNTRVSYSIVLFIIFSFIVGLIPYIFTTDITLIAVNPLAIVLRSFGPITLYLIVSNFKLTNHYVSKVLLVIYFLNFVVVLLQFFILDDVKLVNDGSSVEWVSRGNKSLLLKRVTGLLGNANSLGAFSLASVILLENFFRNKKLLCLIMLVTSFLTIFVFSKSRNVMLTSVIIYIVWLIFNKKFFKSAIVFLLSIMLVYVVVYYKDNDLINSVFRINLILSSESTIDMRGIVNAQAIQIWLNNFVIFGGGLSSEVYYLSRFHAIRNFSEMLYIKLLMEGGFVGLFSYFFVLFYVYFKKIKGKAKKTTIRLFYIAIMLISFAETVFYVQQLYFFTFLVLGAYTAIEKNETQVVK